MQSRVNEVELLILVRPELVEAMDPDQVPPCLPGMNSQQPDDCGLYWKGYIETPVQPYGRMGHGPDGPGHGPMIEEHIPTPEPVTPAPAPAEAPSTRVPPRSSGTVVVSDRPQAPTPPAATARRPAYARQPSAAPNRPSSYNPSNPQTRKTAGPSNTPSDPPGFIGPIGYDVKN
jgi:pilus assembly protein CpaC